jgi:Ferric uptake regulator family.
VSVRKKKPNPSRTPCYWQIARKKSLSIDLYLKRRLSKKRFLTFVLRVEELTSDGGYFSAKGIQRYCRKNRCPVSVGSTYDYLRILNEYGVLTHRFDGQAAYFTMVFDTPASNHFFDLVNIAIERARMKRRRARKP